MLTASGWSPPTRSRSAACFYSVAGSPTSAAAIGGWIVLPATSGPRARAGFDVPGVALATGGLVALVDACTEAVRSGWSSTTVIGLLAASVVLLAFFAFREIRTANPLLPPR